MSALDVLAAHAERCPTCRVAPDPSGFCADGRARWAEVVGESPVLVVPSSHADLPVMFTPHAASPFWRPTESLLEASATNYDQWQQPGGDPVADMQTAFDRIFGK